MFKILGLDQSLSSSGICLLYNFAPEASHLPHERFTATLKMAPPKGKDDRLLQFRRWLIKLLVDYNPHMLICEEPPAGISKSASKNALAELYGVVRLTAQEWESGRENFQFIHVHPSHVKIFATGSGDAEKSEMIESANALAPGLVSNDDEADALWLTEIGLSVMKMSAPQNEAQVYVAAVVRGDPDAAALKASMDKDKNKQKRADNKAAEAVRAAEYEAQNKAECEAKGYVYVSPADRKIANRKAAKGGGDVMAR